VSLEGVLPRSWVDEALGTTPTVKTTASVGLRQPAKPKSWVDEALGTTPQTQPTNPSLLDRAGDAVGTAIDAVGHVMSIPKQGVDALARKSARALGVPVGDQETTGTMMREALGLNKGYDASDPVVPAMLHSMGPVGTAVSGVGSALDVAGVDPAVQRTVAGKGVEFATDTATDPLTYALPQGKFGSVVGGLMAPGMLKGSYQAGRQALDEYSRDGFTPDVAEHAVDAATSGLFGAFAGAHALRGGHPSTRPLELDQAPKLDVAPTPLPEVFDGQAPPEFVPPRPIEPGFVPETTYFDPVQQPLQPSFEQFRPDWLTPEDPVVPPAVSPEPVIAAERPVPPVVPEPVVPEPPVVVEPPPVVPEPIRTAEPVKVAEPLPEPTLDDIISKVEEPAAPLAPRPEEIAAANEVAADTEAATKARPQEGRESDLGDLDYLPEPDRAPTWAKVKESVKAYEATPELSGEAAMEAMLQGLPPEHRQALRNEWIGLATSRGEGRSYLERLNQNFGHVDGPEGTRVEWRSPEDPQGTYYVVQRVLNPATGRNEIVGGGLTRNGVREFVVGGQRVMDSPTSVGPVYKLMGKPSDTTTAAGGSTQRRYLRKQGPEPILEGNSNGGPENIAESGRGSSPLLEAVPGGSPEGNRPGDAGPLDEASPTLRQQGQAPEAAPSQVEDVTRPLSPIPEAPSVDPQKRFFDRDAATARMRQRGRRANDLTAAAAEGPGALRDAAIVGASYIEDFARTTKGKIPSFTDWARAVGQKLAAVIPNVQKFLRQIYDESVALFRGRSKAEPTPAVETNAPEVPASSPAGPPIEPPKPVEAGAMGAPKPIGEPARVETKTENLREVAPETKLSRDEPRSWESLDPKIRDRVREVTTDPKAEESLYRRAADGKIDDVDTQTLDALVRSKKEAYDSARQELLKAQGEGRDAGPQNITYLKAALDQVAADYAKAAKSDVEAGTKIARALAARARIMEAAPKSAPDAFLKKVFRTIPDITEKHATELVRILNERPQDLADALNAALKPGKIDKFLEAWKAGLVSGPGTQVANVLGNAGEQIVRVGETATAALIDRLIGGDKARFGGEAKFELQGSYSGAKHALGRLGSDIKDVLTLAPEKINLSQGLENQVGKIGGRTGRAIRIPFRLLGAFDQFFKGMGGEAELYKLAYRRSKGNVKEALRLVERDADGNFPNAPADVMAQVRTSQMERTYQNPDATAQALTQLRSRNRLLHVVLPFVQTPTNIAKLAVKRSPLGFIEGTKAVSKWREAIRSGADAQTVAQLRGEAVDKLARPLVGTGLMLTFGALAKAGGMTGSGPVDNREKNALRDEGWQPYSFVITNPSNGKKVYVPFNRFEPISSLLGFAADMAEAPDSKTGNDLLAKGVGSVIQNLASKTYLQGIADAAELVHDPMGAGSKYVTNLAGTLVPNIVAKTAQAIDPAVRDTRAEKSGLSGAPEAALKTIGSRLPGVSTLLPERRSGTGENIERRGNAVTRLLSPVQPSEEEEGLPFAQLLVDLEAVPGAQRKAIKVRGKDVRLTDDEFKALQDADSKTTAELKKLTVSPGFKRLDPERQRAIIRNHYDRGRGAARNKVIQSSSFRRRAREAK
jgi:hypothetical protein